MLVDTTGSCCWETVEQTDTLIMDSVLRDTNRYYNEIKIINLIKYSAQNP